MSMDIKLLNVGKKYGSKTVLNGISLDIVQGNFIAVLGRSGAGKSTLLSVMNTLLRPDEGKVFFNGIPCSRMNPVARTRLRSVSLSVILQRAFLFRNLTVKANILLPFRLAGRSGFPEQYRTFLEEFGLKRKESLFPHQLSGGEIQKIVLLRSVLSPWEVLIADEPTGDLDRQTTEIILRLFRKLNSQGRTIIMTTHNDVLAAAAWDRYVLHDGKLYKEK